MLSRHLNVAILVGIVFCGTAEPAAAQFRSAALGTGAAVLPFYSPFAPSFIPPAGFGPYVVGADPFGGYLSGGAGLISSSGDFVVDTQAAYLLQQDVAAQMIENRRAAFDEWLYERAHMPTLNDDRKRTQDQETERARSRPPRTEIWAGKSLNDLLASIQQAQVKGFAGTDVPIRPTLLKQINVTGTSQGNAGLLKNVGPLKWPIALQTLPQEKEAEQLREQINQLLKTATDQAARGTLDGPTIIQLTKSVHQLRGQLTDNIDNLSMIDYAAAKRFLAAIDDAVTVLKSPNADKYINGSLAAKGKTVKELVQYMADNGLHFAPALAGEEEAYNAVYNALLSYEVPTAALMTAADSTSPSSK